MRVLQVIPDLSPLTGGPVSALKALAQAQAASDIETTILTTDYGIDRVPDVPGVEIHAFPFRWSTWRWSPQVSEYLKGQVRKFDIVAIDSLWQHTTFTSAAICRKAGVPYVIKPNGMLEQWSLAQKTWKKQPYLRCIEASRLHDAAALHATSAMEVMSSRMHERNANVFVLSVGVPLLPAADPELFLQQFPQLRDRPIILFLGRVHHGKQPDILITALHLISERYPSAVLVVAGPYQSGYRRQLQTLARELGLDSRVMFPGFLNPELARSACRASTIFVLPSLQESFGVAVAEAMAQELPVIVSNRVGIAPLIDKSGAGLVTCPTAEATAAALSILLADGFMRKRMGENGRRLVSAEFTADAIASELRQIYVDILEGTRFSSCWLPAASGVDAPTATPATTLR